MQQIDWIFIDVGDTLMDEEAAQEKRFVETIAVAQEQGLALTREKIREAMGRAAQSLVREGLRDDPNAPSPYIYGEAMTLLGLPSSLERRYDKSLEHPFPGAQEVIRQLHERYHIAVVANQPLGTEARMEQYGFLPHLDRVFGSAEAGIEKPDPRFFVEAMRAVGAVPERSVMIGDRLDNDIAPAKSLGMHTIWIVQGYGVFQTPTSPAFEPDETVHTLQEILERGIL